MSFLTASTREQYGLRLALRLVSSYYTKRPISLSGVASKEQISAKYLEELVVPLRKRKLVKAVAGRNGGYIFNKNPHEVSVKDVIWSMGESHDVALCVSKDAHCPMSRSCAAKDVWQTVQAQVEKSLGNMTLDKLVKNFDK